MSMLFPLGHKKRINNMVKTQKSKPRQTVRQALLALKTGKKKKKIEGYAEVKSLSLE